MGGVYCMLRPLIGLLLLVKNIYALIPAPRSNRIQPLSSPSLSHRRPQLDPPLPDISHSFSSSATPTELHAGKDYSSTSSGIAIEFDAPRIFLLSLCFMVTILMSLDKVAMSVGIIPMSVQFGYNDLTKGLISTMFSIGYLFGLLPAGVLGSTRSPKLVLSAGVMLWSIAQAFTPLAANLGLNSLLAARFIMGAAEATAIPTLQTFVSNWVPDKKKSLVLGIIYSGLQVGNVLAYFISPYILDAAGWEGLFEIYGTVGILWLALWLSPIIKDTPETENALLAEVLPQKSLRESLSAIPWAQVFGSKEVRAISVAHSVGNFGMYINLAWVPTYYSSHFGLSAGESSVNSIAPWVCAAVCSSLAGGAADALLSRGISRTTVRRFMQSVALLVPAAAMLFLGLEPTLDPQETELCFVVACSASALGVAGFGSSVQDVCRSSKLTSLLYSVTSAPAVLCGSLGVYGTGLLLDAYQDWTLVFTATAAVYAIGAYYYATNYEAKKIFE